MTASIDDLLRRALSSVATTFDAESESDREMTAKYGELVERHVGGWDFRVKVADDGSVVSSTIVTPEVIYTVVGFDDREWSKWNDAVLGRGGVGLPDEVAGQFEADDTDDPRYEVELVEWPADLDDTDDEPDEVELVASVPTPAVTEPPTEPAVPARRSRAVSWVDEDAPGWKPWRPW